MKIKNTKSLGKFLVGTILSVILFIWVLYNANLNTALSALKDVRLPFLLLGIIFHLSSFFLRSVRWSIILSPIKNIKARKIFSIIAISFMANNLFPFRAGDIIRAILIGDREKISKSAAFSTVILERVIDGLTLLFFLGAVSAIISLPQWAKQVRLMCSIIFGFALLLIIILCKYEDKVVHILPSMSFFKKKQAFFEIILKGIESVKSVKNIVLIFILSILIWMCEGSIFYFCFYAFQFNLDIPMAIFILVLVNLGTLIPSSPGYIGTFEFVCATSLTYFGINPSIAAVYSFIVHLAQYVPITMIGICYCMVEGIKFYEIKQKEVKL